MSVKLEGFVKPYRGKTDLSWDVFWSKFLVLAEVSGWDTAEKRMARLPLFLEGDAFLVFSRMQPADQKDQEKVAALMKKSFSVSKSEAFQCFTQRKLRLDESVDAFAADLRGLLALAGHKDSEEKDAVVIEQNFGRYPSPSFAAGASLVCWEGLDGGELHGCNTRVVASIALGRRRCCGKQFVFGQ